MSLKPFRLHRLEKGPLTKVTLTKQDALTYYKKMSTIRRVENTSANLYMEKVIRGFCHLYAGQVRSPSYLAGFFFTMY